MSEIKTCEQYVLNKLEESENEIEQLKSEADAMSELMTQTIKNSNEISDLNSKLIIENAKLTKLLKIVRKYATIEVDEEYGKFCQFKKIYECSDEQVDDYNFLCSILEETNNGTVVSD